MSYVKKFFEGFDQIICLNLEVSAERREHVTNIFEKYDLGQPYFLQATSAEDEIVKKYYEKGLVHTYPPCFRCGKMECGSSSCNNVLIEPQVANFISYLNIWRHIEENNIRSALIIEDDIEFSGSIDAICQQILENNLLQATGLYSNEPVLVRFGWALAADHSKLTAVKLVPNLLKMANPSYAINQAMARKLLENFSVINTTSDYYIHRDIGLQVNNFTSIPPLFYEKSWSTGEFDSLIHPKEIRLEYLKNEFGGESREYARALNALQRHVSHMYNFKFLIVGHPRCGSGYMSEIFRLNGIDVGHEEVRKDGVASWMFAVDDDPYPFYKNELAARRKDKYFAHTICYIRNPVDAIPSIAVDNRYSEESYEFRRKHIDRMCSVDLNSFETNLERAVASYVFWYQIVLDQSPNIIIRIEEDENKLRDFIRANKKMGWRRFWWRSLGTKVNSNKLYKGVAYKKEQFSQEDWRALPDVLVKKLNDICQKVGYPNPLLSDKYA